MQQTLVIYLHAHENSHPDWVVMGDGSRILQTVQQGDALELANLACR